MKFIYFFLILMLMVSCSEETPFTDKPFSNTFATPAANSYTNIHCANSTTINPQVDVLFLIDNSTSTFYLSSDLRNQITSLLSSLDNYDFDYHAMVAPLLNDGTNLDDYPVLSNTQDLPISVNVTTPANFSLFTNNQSGSVELGFQRARDIINANKSNNVFRVNSNTLVITVSNGDDTDYPMNSYGQPMGDNFSVRLNDLKKLTAQYYNSVIPPASALMSRQLRFISIVAHSTSGSCSDFKVGARYRNMSHQLYLYSGQTDQGGKTYPDSYDFCSGSFSSIFTDISNSIPALYVPHTYDHWPVRDVNTINFNVNAIEVKKVVKGVSGDTVVNIPASATNGFQFVNSYLTNHNIREIPTVSPAYPPENFNGYFVQLFGSAKVTSPDCLIIKIQDPNVFYGYVTIPKQPKLDETIVKKNGTTLSYIANPVPSSNGWTYQGYSPSLNIVIQGPADHTPGSPTEYKEGYVIKLLGTGTYTNEDVIEVHYRTVTN
jgi:hypothetical protein